MDDPGTSYTIEKEVDFSDHWGEVSVTSEVLRGQILRKCKQKENTTKQYDVVDDNIGRPRRRRRRCRKRPCVACYQDLDCIHPFVAKHVPVSVLEEPLKQKARRSKRKDKCSLRVMELAQPLKKHCLDTFQYKGHALPAHMVERLRVIIRDERPMVQIHEAVECFRTKKRRKLRQKFGKADIPVDYEKPTKRQTEITYFAAIFVHRINKKLIFPMITAPTSEELEMLARIVEKKIKPLSRTRTARDIAMLGEVSHKIAFWIDSVIEDVNDNLLMEEIQEIEEKEGPALDILDEIFDKVTHIPTPQKTPPPSDVEDIVESEQERETKLDNIEVATEELEDNEGDTNAEPVQENNLLRDVPGIQNVVVDYNAIDNEDEPENVAEEQDSSQVEKDDEVVANEETNPEETQDNLVTELNETNIRILSESNIEETDPPTGDNQSATILSESNIDQIVPPTGDNQFAEILPESNIDQIEPSTEDNQSAEMLPESNIDQKEPPTENNQSAEILPESNIDQIEPPTEDNKSAEILPKSNIDQIEPPTGDNQSAGILPESNIDQIELPTGDNQSATDVSKTDIAGFVDLLFFEAEVSTKQPKKEDHEPPSEIENNSVQETVDDTDVTEQETTDTEIKQIYPEPPKSAIKNTDDTIVTRDSSTRHLQKTSITWSQSKYIRNILLGPLNPDLLFKSDEVWPNDIPYPPIGPNASTIKSMTSLGKLCELDELTLLDIDKELHNIEMHEDIETKQDNSTVEEFMSTTDLNVKVDNTLEFAKGDDFDQRSDENLVMDEKESPHTSQDNVQIESIDQSIDIPKTKFNYRVDMKTAPAWVKRKLNYDKSSGDTNKETMCPCVPSHKSSLGLTPLEARMWVIDLEVSLEKVQRWNSKIEAICDVIICMKKSEATYKKYQVHYSQTHLKEWVRVKDNVNEDVNQWNKLHASIRKKLRKYYHPKKRERCFCHQNDTSMSL